MQPASGNQRPDLLTRLTPVSLVLRVPREVHLSRSTPNVPRLPTFLKLLQNPHVLLTFDKVHNPLGLPRETASERPKVVRTCGAFNILTWKHASRRNGVHCFDMSTFKSVPRMVCFEHFDLEMCFVPERRALFQQLDFQKCFTLFTSKCASHHNGVQFLIFYLPRWLCTRRFREPTFRPSGATTHWKNTVFCDFFHFYFFAHLHLLSSDSFSFWSSFFFPSLLRLFPLLHFDLSILSEVWLLNFLRSLYIIYSYI